MIGAPSSGGGGSGGSSGGGLGEGGGSGGFVAIPGAIPALNNPNNPNDSANCSSPDGIRAAHAMSDIGYTRTVRGVSALPFGSIAIITYDNGQKENFNANIGTATPVLGGLGCG